MSIATFDKSKLKPQTLFILSYFTILGYHNFKNSDLYSFFFVGASTVDIEVHFYSLGHGRINYKDDI